MGLNSGALTFIPGVKCEEELGQTLETGPTETLLENDEVPKPWGCEDWGLTVAGEVEASHVNNGTKSSGTKCI